MLNGCFIIAYSSTLQKHRRTKVFKILLNLLPSILGQDSLGSKTERVKHASVHTVDALLILSRWYLKTICSWQYRSRFFNYLWSHQNGEPTKVFRLSSVSVKASSSEVSKFPAVLIHQGFSHFKSRCIFPFLYKFQTKSIAELCTHTLSGTLSSAVTTFILALLHFV